MTFDITSMLDPEVYNHPVEHIELIETHISWVLLTGKYAYKIKKPVNFGFLDFSTLKKRQACCEQELYLNRRLASSIYLDVVAISAVKNKSFLSISGDDGDNNEIIEYAVKMLQFQQSAQFDHMLATGELDKKHMDATARMVAEFHQAIKVCDDSMDYGNKDMIYQPVKENFTQINEHLETEPYVDKLDALTQWCRTEYVKLEYVFEQRKHDGFIRECHGDMHLRNLVWLNGRALAFDCIEFSSKLRWIDVMSEIAFLIMDLQDRKQQLLANRFLNSYLEITGDYEGLSVLTFYLCYRAMVRAKVAALRLEQENIATEERKKSLTEFESYLELATTYTQQPTPKLLIMRGLSASGKSTVSQQLLEEFTAIRIRSDVERKRIFEVAFTGDTENEVESGIYSAQASQQTYAKLTELASQIITAGYSVIVDAAFLKHEQRKPFQLLAESLNVPYIILEIIAPAETLRQRIRQRKNDVSDADLTILEYQLANFKPLHESEAYQVITVDTVKPLDIKAMIDEINAC
ncbi:MAG: AAA family ATPase [Gammaproteobacteria bacterium]